MGFREQGHGDQLFAKWNKQILIASKYYEYTIYYLCIMLIYFNKCVINNLQILLFVCWYFLAY